MIRSHVVLLPYRKYLLAAVLVAALGGCAGAPKPGTTSAGQVQFVNNAQQVSEVVTALELGDTKKARKLLKPLLKRDPSNIQFRTLKMSMEVEPASILSRQSFAYTVKRDDRMTSLSTRYLKDPLKFFLLVRYNGLKNAQLTTGQILRIPGVEPAPEPMPVVRNRPAPTPATQSPSIVPKKATAAAAVPAAPKTDPKLANSLRARGLAALNRGSVAQAVASLRQAQAADPGNAAIKRDLDRAERLLASVKARK